jgi:hypothetical protein
MNKVIEGLVETIHGGEAFVRYQDGPHTRRVVARVRTVGVEPGVQVRVDVDHETDWAAITSVIGVGPAAA